MGLDAFVRCRCWEEGRFKPPPVPVEELAIDRDGWLSLREDRWDENDESTWEISRRVSEWRESACEHPDMDFACEGVSNWSGVRLFRHSLEVISEAEFPVLLAEIPTSNGGRTEPRLAGAALRELDRFAHAVSRLPQRVEVRDAATTETLFVGDSDQAALWVLGREGHAYVVGDALVIVSPHDDATVKFASRRFRQEVLRIKPLPNGGREVVAKLTDQERGASVTSHISFSLHSDEGTERFPELIEVVTRPTGLDDFSWIVHALRRLFKASIETGNPVVWC